MSRGRKAGSRNRGFFFRKGRGWQTKVDGPNGERTVFVALTDEHGHPIKDRSAPVAVLQAALKRVENHQKLSESTPGVPTLHQVCSDYLRHVEQAGATSTYNMRADSLFDFCYGLPARLRRDSGATADKIPPGYGAMPADQLRPFHVIEWLDAHPTWKDRRSRIQALKRALNFAVETGRISANPIKGNAWAKGQTKPRPRVVVVTPEQEAALLSASKPALRTAIRVLIRTGMRPGEFAKMTADHVTETPRGYVVHFQPDETKTKTLRTIRVADAGIVELIRAGISAHPSGPIFRSPRGKTWDVKELSRKFREAKKRAEKRGQTFDADCCLYSLRHTFAKRTLTGHWTGRMINVELLAKMMGNTPEVCRAHYLQWAEEAVDDHLWDAAG